MFASLTNEEPLRGWNHSAEPLREALLRSVPWCLLPKRSFDCERGRVHSLQSLAKPLRREVFAPKGHQIRERSEHRLWSECTRPPLAFWLE
jgi:hypothetical protein